MIRNTFLISMIMLILSTNYLNAQEIKIVTESYPPLNYEEDGKVIGISTMIVKAVMEKAGITANINIYPWPRAYDMALKGENVLIYCIVKTTKREKLFKWIGPLLPYTESLFKLKKRKDIRISSLNDAKQYKTGVIREYAVHQMLLNQGFENGKNVEPISAQEINIKKLFAGRVDMIVGSRLDLSWRMRMQPNFPSFDELEEVFELKEIVTDLYMAFGLKTSDKVVTRIRTAYEQIKTEGIIDNILQNQIE